MKLFLALGTSLTLSVTAAEEGESPKPVPVTPDSKTQPLPRTKTENPEKPARPPGLNGKLEDHLTERRARVAEARKKARERAKASRDALKPRVPELVLPKGSAPKEKLTGSWTLQGESLGRSLTTQFQKAAGKGATFKLSKMTGDYMAEINPELNRITVLWKDWKMESVTSRGDLAVTLTVAVEGSQEYEIVELIDSEKRETRKIRVRLIKDETTSESFFQGARMRTKVDLPGLTSGHWAISEGILYLQGSQQEEAWKFDQKAKE